MSPHYPLFVLYFYPRWERCIYFTYNNKQMIRNIASVLLTYYIRIKEVFTFSVYYLLEVIFQQHIIKIKVYEINQVFKCECF